NIRENRCPKIDARADKLDADRTGPDPEAWKRGVKAATRRLKVRCTEVMRAIAREVGEDRRAYDRQKELRSLLSGGGPNAEDGPRVAATAAMLEFLKGDQGPRDDDLPLEWVRWWRWTGMLGIASRSYRAARKSLLRGSHAV